MSLRIGLSLHDWELMTLGMLFDIFDAYRKMSEEILQESNGTRTATQSDMDWFKAHG